MASSFNLTKNPGTLNLAVFGDVHLGNRRTLAPDVIRGLDSFFPNNHETKALDMIVIEGDLFDEGLTFYSEFLGRIQNWMLRLLKTCKDNNIALRVLEGTPSHDMHQSRQFAVLLEATKWGIDFKYVEDLELERHPKFGDILYVPDEWGDSNEHCYTSARNLLSLHGLTKVDYCIFHGAFEHQLPPIKGIPTHDSKAWQELVTYALFAGHIHQYSKYGLIIAAGSADRFTQGDEEPKGHIRASLSPNGSKFTFVENKFAKKYITIDCRHLSVDAALDKIKKSVKVPKGSFIRIKYTTTDNLMPMKPYLRAEYPDYYWDDIVEDAGTEKLEQKLLPETIYQSVHLNATNLVSLMQKRMEVAGVEPEKIKVAIAKLEALCTT